MWLTPGRVHCHALVEWAEPALRGYEGISANGRR